MRSNFLIIFHFYCHIRDQRPEMHQKQPGNRTLFKKVEKRVTLFHHIPTALDRHIGTPAATPAIKYREISRKMSNDNLESLSTKVLRGGHTCIECPSHIPAGGAFAPNAPPWIRQWFHMYHLHR